ncbi:MAG: ECF-type sigma factor [Phycisphaerales bacterium JB039]
MPLGPPASHPETPPEQWYQSLRAIASQCLRQERPGSDLQTTAIVHDAYVRLAGAGAGQPQTPEEFGALAAKVIRNVLVDQARARKALKRGGGVGHVPLDTTLLEVQAAQIDVLELDDALRRLAELDERQARVVELRFFGGLTMEQIALLLGVGRATVDRDWRWARAWLGRDLGQRGAP